MRPYQSAATVTLSIRPFFIGTTLSFYHDDDPCQVHSNCDDCVHDVCSAKSILKGQHSNCVYCPPSDYSSEQCVSSQFYLFDCSPIATETKIFSSELTGSEKRVRGDPMDLSDANLHECTAASSKDSKGACKAGMWAARSSAIQLNLTSHVLELSCSAMSEANGYVVDFTNRFFCTARNFVLRFFHRFIFSKGEHHLSNQQSPPNGQIHYFNYNISVGLCQETTAFPLYCFQKANVPVRASIYTINQIVYAYNGSNEGFCWNIGTISQQSKPRFTNESKDNFEVTIDYGSMPCCPSDRVGPGSSQSVSVAVKIIPARSKNNSYRDCTEADFVQLKSSSNVVAMMLNCSFSLNKSATIYFETNLFCPEKLFVALDTDKTSYKCSKHSDGSSCRIVPSPLKNVSNYQHKCNPKQFQISVRYEGNHSVVVLPNVLKTNCTFFVDSSVAKITVKYRLAASFGWKTIKGHLGSRKLSPKYIGIISGGGAVAGLISVLVVVVIKKQRSSRAHSASETQSIASNAGIDSKEVWNVLCLYMSCHSSLMKTKVIKVLHEIDKRIRILDTKAPGRSYVGCLTEAVQNSSFVLVGVGKNKNMDEVKSFHSDVQFAITEKRCADEPVVPVLLNGSRKDIPGCIGHLNLVDLRNPSDDSYNEEISRLQKAVHEVLDRAK